MTSGSVAFCIATAFAVFAAYIKKAKVDDEKAKNDEIANLKIELSKLQTELADAKSQHRSEVDDIHTGRQTQFIQLVDILYHNTRLVDTLRKRGSV